MAKEMGLESLMITSLLVPVTRRKLVILNESEEPIFVSIITMWIGAKQEMLARVHVTPFTAQE